MFLKRNENGPFVGELPYLPLLSEKTARHGIGAAGGTFNGVYMRPSIANGGHVPATGPLCYSPDIWIANQTPIPNYQAALATPDSYASTSSSNINGGMPNFIYVRGFNNTNSSQTRTVTLYYAASSLTCWPDQWRNNVLSTDQDLASASIVNAPPMTVAVADGTFVWNNPPPPPEGSDHYCLIAQFNDSANSNPFPDVHTLLDMGQLVQGNLGWGWRNTTFIPGSGGQQAYVEPLDVPFDPPDNPSHKYDVIVTPTGFVGWDIQLDCSQAGSDGSEMGLPRTTIKADDQLMGFSCLLEAPFSAKLFVTLWSNGNKAAPGSTIPIELAYNPVKQWAAEAFARGLVDPVLLAAMQRVARDANRISPQAVVAIGGYNWTVRA